MKTKNSLIIGAAGIVVIAAVIIFINFSAGSSEKPMGSAKQAIKSVGVKAEIIRPKPLKNIIYSNGTLISNESVDLRSETSGKITSILFEEGKWVKRGDLLIKINDADLQATLKKNKARSGLARDIEYRYKQLLEKGLTSQQEYDAKLSELNSVLADVEFTEAQIAKTEIKAPFDGIIGLRSVSVGSAISPDIKIATLQSINPIKVDFSVPQKYFGLIREGKTIYVRLTSVNRSFTGTIYAIEPKIDQNTRTVQARAKVANDRGELTPGAYVEIEIVLEELRNAVMVPTGVIVPDISGEKIYLYKSGIAVPVPIETGIRTAEVIQIKSGVETGDTLIVSGIIQLRPGIRVKLNSIN